MRLIQVEILAVTPNMFLGCPSQRRSLLILVDYVYARSEKDKHTLLFSRARGTM